MRWGRRGLLHCGQTFRPAASTPCWARRWSRRALEVFRLGTAIGSGLSSSVTAFSGAHDRSARHRLAPKGTRSARAERSLVGGEDLFAPGAEIDHARDLAQRGVLRDVAVRAGAPGEVDERAV